MNGVRDLLEAHRKDVVALLEKVTKTARLHSSSELAGAITSIARAQMLLAEELDYLADEEGSGSTEEEGVLPRSNDANLVKGFRRR